MSLDVLLNFLYMFIFFKGLLLYVIIIFLYMYVGYI